MGGGLHHVWLRKYGDGTVKLRVLVDGREVGRTEGSNRSGWRIDHFDTSAFVISRRMDSSRSGATDAATDSIIEP